MKNFTERLGTKWHLEIRLSAPSVSGIRASANLLKTTKLRHNVRSAMQARRSPVALLEEIKDHIKTCIYEEYDDAANQLAYVEGEYVGAHWDTEDLLLDEIELDLPKDNDEKVANGTLGLPGDITWCERNGYGLDDQNRARFSWARFCEVVMHRRRFFFSDYEKEPYEETYSPGEVLDKLFQDAERYDLFQVLPPDSKLFRVRLQKAGNELTTAQDLGPPPKELAKQSNRMSPPGIPMFYACDDPETALKRDGQ